MNIQKLSQFIISSILIVLLTACSTAQFAPSHLTTKTKAISQETKVCQANYFEVSGKVGFRDGQNGGTTHLRWIQRNNSYQIRLYGPLGSGALEINGEGKSVFLTKPDGKVIYAKSPEDLIRNELGWTIPVSGLRYWILGCQAPGKPPKSTKQDNYLKLWQMEQHGWQVTYQTYVNTHGLTMPQKLDMSNGPIHIKFVFHSWKVQS